MRIENGRVHRDQDQRQTVHRAEEMRMHRETATLRIRPLQSMYLDSRLRTDY